MTGIGYVVIILAILALIFNRRYLIYLVSFFSVFTAASIFNITKGKLHIGIQPILFLGGIWILYVFIKNIILLKNREIKLRDLFSGYDKKTLIAIVSFAIISFLSILMPIFLKDKFKIITTDYKVEPIHFTSSNIMQYIMILFMFVLVFSIIIEVKDKKTYKGILNSFIFGSFFASVFGIVQFILGLLNINYPHELFNNNIMYSQQYDQWIVKGIRRINSIAVEPSMLAINLIIILPIIIMLWIGQYRILKNRIFSNIFLLVDILITIAVVILTTSTTAYIGFALGYILVILFTILYRNKDSIVFKNRYKIFVLIGISIIFVLIAGIIAIFALGVNVSKIQNAFLTITVNKKYTGSGVQRIAAFKEGILLMKKSPILGVGVGTYRSFDLFSNLLSTTGILGFISFLSIIVLTSVNLFRNITRNNGHLKLGLFIGFISCILTMMLSVPDITYGFIWIVVALSIVKKNII